MTECCEWQVEKASREASVREDKLLAAEKEIRALGADKSLLMDKVKAYQVGICSLCGHPKPLADGDDALPTLTPTRT